jgi:N-acetylglucosaminyldiphosphoundecaprenol N-acetyl-beta-D-mannosaminyltransferase
MHTSRAKDFLGLPIHLIGAGDAFEQILAWRSTGLRSYITVVNPHSLVTCSRDANMHAAIRGCNLALPDGVGITLAARILGYGNSPRVAGPSLMFRVCDLGRAHGLRHFFYGGGDGVAALLARRLALKLPGLEVSGWLCPPFRAVTEQEDADIVNRINASSADVVWVGLGTGKQEKWMAAHVGLLRPSVLVGVGAAFDFHSGRVPWAPSWVRRAGLEWAYRLAHEPRRLWRRNLDSPVFLAKVVAQRMGLPVARIDSQTGISSCKKR